VSNTAIAPNWSDIMSNMGITGWGRVRIERIEALLERIKAAAFAALSKTPDVAKKASALAVAPGSLNFVVGAFDVSKVNTAFAFQVQFVSEDGTLHQADSARFTTTVQGDAVTPVATTTTPLVVQAGNMAVSPVYTVVLNGTMLEARVSTAGLANPINVAANFYADIESF
jgi:hypothetical protein